MDRSEWNELERAAAATSSTRSRNASWFSTEGRISRETYWIGFQLPIFLLPLIIAGVGEALGIGDSDRFAFIVGLAFLALLFPLAVGYVKRLHDLGRSGWYFTALLGGGVGWTLTGPIINSLVGGRMPFLVYVLPLAAFWIAALWLNIMTGFIRGTRGPNKYGPDPLADRGRP